MPDVNKAVRFSCNQLVQPQIPLLVADSVPMAPRSSSSRIHETYRCQSRQGLMSLAEACLIISSKVIGQGCAICRECAACAGYPVQEYSRRSYGLYASTKPSTPPCGSRNLLSSAS